VAGCGQYRRRAVPMPLALWSVLAGGFAATVSILLLLLVGARWPGSWPMGKSSPVRWSWWPEWWRVAAVHHLPTLTRWLEDIRARRGVHLLRRLARKTSGVMRFPDHGAGGAWCSASAWPTGRWTCSC